MPVIHTYTNSSLPSPLQVAKVKVLAGQEKAIGKTASAVLDRIQKCLSHAQHLNTPEQEALTAWRMASRLMTENNVEQADLLQRIADQSKCAEVGDKSVVAVKSTKGEGARLIRQFWVNDVARAVAKLFDCKYYSQHGSVSYDWIFYGISANTVAAAMAFEMAFNLIEDWARYHKGAGAKRSYYLGISTNLNQIAIDEKKTEEQEIKKEENRNEQAAARTWATKTALVQFRDCAEKVAIEYLKAQNIRLHHHHGRKRTSTAINQAAYQAGVDDSKRIDLKRKRVDNE